MKNLIVVVLLMIAAAVPGSAAAQLLSAVVPVSLVGLDFDEDDLPPLRLVLPREVMTGIPVGGAARGQVTFPVSALVDGTEVAAEERRCAVPGQMERVEIVMAPRGQALPIGAGCRRIPLKGGFRWSRSGGVINLRTRQISSGSGAAAQPPADLGGPLPFRQVQMRWNSGIGRLRTNFAQQGCERFNTDLSRAAPQCDGDDTARSVQAGLDVNLEFAPRLGLLLGGVYRNNTGVSFEGTATSGIQQLTNRATGEIKKVWQGKVGLEWRPVDRLSVSGYWAPAHTWSAGTFSDELRRDSIRLAGGTTTSLREDSDHRMWGATANYRITGPWGAQFDYFAGSHPNAFPATNNARAPQDVDGTSLVGSMSYTLVTYRRPTAPDTSEVSQVRDFARRWSARLAAGYSGNWGQTAGDANPFARGTPFVTFSGRPGFFVPSWNFGHGAEILNLVAAEMGVAERLTPLDVITASGRAFAHARGPHYDAEVSRWLNALIGMYGRVAFAANPLELPDDIRSQIDTTALSAQQTWSAVLRPGSGVATSLATYDGGSGGRMAATGGLQFRTGSIGSWQPVFHVGAGTVWGVGTAPRADIVTDYRFAGGGGARFHETDRVAIWAVSSHALALEGGADVRHAMTDRLDLVFGANLLAYRNTVGIEVSATPERETSAPPGATAFTSSPSIQFGNDPRLPPSSLSSELQNFRAFTGTGWRVSPQIKAGVVWRF